MTVAVRRASIALLVFFASAIACFPPTPGRFEMRARSHRSSTAPRAERNPVAEVVAVAEVIGKAHPGDTVHVAAIARDAYGHRVADARLRYMIAARGAAVMQARIGADGDFVADSAGLFLVLVESNGLAARVPILIEPRPIVVSPMRSEDSAGAKGVARLATVNVTAAPTARVRVSAPDYEPYVGTTVRLRATIWGEGSDEPDSTAAPQWGTSNPDVAIVDHRGTVMFLHPGFVTISATHGGRTAHRRMQVWPSPAARVVLRSDAHYPRAGDVVKLTDYAWQRGGYPVHHFRSNLAVMTPDGSPAAGASISENKEFVARIPGTYTVMSELNGLTSAVTFTVHAAGARCELGLRRWDPSCDR